MFVMIIMTSKVTVEFAALSSLEDFEDSLQTWSQIQFPQKLTNFLRLGIGCNFGLLLPALSPFLFSLSGKGNVNNIRM